MPMRTPLPAMLASALTLTVIASGTDAWPGPPTDSEARHSSGIVLVGPRDYWRPDAKWRLSDQLMEAYNGARVLADPHRAAFGHPWPDNRADAVVVRVANAEGEALARRWIEAGVRDMPGTLYARDIPPPRVRVRLQTVDRTIEQLDRIQHAVGPGLRDIPGNERIMMSGPDPEQNRIVYTTDRFDEAMLRALAARFGTEALAVRIDPHLPRLSTDFRPPPLANPNADMFMPIILGAIALGAAALLLIEFALPARPRRIPV
jgi:hypothetical protein